MLRAERGLLQNLQGFVVGLRFRVLVNSWQLGWQKRGVGEGEPASGATQEIMQVQHRAQEIDMYTDNRGGVLQRSWPVGQNKQGRTCVCIIMCCLELVSESDAILIDLLYHH